jgi:selenide,water dikinase
VYPSQAVGLSAAAGVSRSRETPRRAVAPARGRRLVLVGAGHAHVEVLRRWALAPLPGVELTVVEPRARAIYSGMVPGFVAGQYRAAELEIDVAELARRAGARWRAAAAGALDASARRLHAGEGPALDYDVLSLDVGSTVAGLDLPGVREHALATRPIAALLRGLDDALARARGEASGGRFRVVVVGAGAGGVELAFCLERRLRDEGVAEPDVRLLDAQPVPLADAHRRLRARVEREAARRGIRFHGARRVAGVEAGRLRLEGGDEEPWDLLVWAAGAAAQPFPGPALPCDARGFVRVGPSLQVPGHPEVFAAGDCASLEHAAEVPKAGVYAVRAGPVLDANLRALLRGQALRAYRPQADFLSLLNLGDGTAIGAKWGLVVQGRWVMRLKDRIDRGFVARYR